MEVNEIFHIGPLDPWQGSKGQESGLPPRKRKKEREKKEEEADDGAEQGGLTRDDEGVVHIDLTA